MNLPRPPWECRDERDRQNFKKWMNKQLDDLAGPDIDMGDPAFAAEVEQQFTRQLKRGRVIKAAQRKDRNAISRLTANDPALTALAFRALTHVRQRGRETGDRHSRDLKPIERALLEDACRELDCIREICIRSWGQWKGSGIIAIEIAAERAQLDEDRLNNFRKNRARYK